MPHDRPVLQTGEVLLDGYFALVLYVNNTA